MERKSGISDRPQFLVKGKNSKHVTSKSKPLASSSTKSVAKRVQTYYGYPIYFWIFLVTISAVLVGFLIYMVVEFFISILSYIYVLVAVILVYLAQKCYVDLFSIKTGAESETEANRFLYLQNQSKVDGQINCTKILAVEESKRLQMNLSIGQGAQPWELKQLLEGTPEEQEL